MTDSEINLSSDLRMIQERHVHRWIAFGRVLDFQDPRVYLAFLDLNYSYFVHNPYFLETMR